MSTIQIVGYFYAWILLGIAFTWCIRGLWRDRQSWAAHKHGMRVIWRDVRSGAILRFVASGDFFRELMKIIFGSR